MVRPRDPEKRTRTRGYGPAGEPVQNTRAYGAASIKPRGTDGSVVYGPSAYRVGAVPSPAIPDCQLRTPIAKNRAKVWVVCFVDGKRVRNSFHVFV